jgi:hypothetical protein
LFIWLIVLADNQSQPVDRDAASPLILSATNGAFTLAARR